MNKLRDWLWIADRPKTCETPLGEIGVSYVVSACQDDTHVTDVHYPLEDADDADENAALFRAAVDDVLEARDRGETVLVHCHAGMSRSAAVCIAAIAVVEGTGFETTRWNVKSKRGIKMAPQLKLMAQRYILDDRRLKRNG